jgi:carbon-monoxide dehydrogenase small subunit
MSTSPAPAPARRQLSLTVNGRKIEAEIEPRELLLDFLRDRLRLTGAKRSCDVQVCGACTVLVDGLPVSACCTLAYEARGREVVTIEGLGAGGALDQVQAAFVERSAVQCGFCTPGMVLAITALLRDNPQPSVEAIQQHLKGNLCRCTGYWTIIEAVQAASRSLAEANGGAP